MQVSSPISSGESIFYHVNRHAIIRINCPKHAHIHRHARSKKATLRPEVARVPDPAADQEVAKVQDHQVGEMSARVPGEGSEGLDPDEANAVHPALGEALRAAEPQARIRTQLD